MREFAAEPFAAALGVSTRAGMELMADAMELRYRLPGVGARVEDLSLAPWRARRIAQATAALSPRAAAYVDEVLAPVADRCGAVRIDRAVAEAVALFDPEVTEQVEDEAEASWGVHLTHGVGPTWSGTSSLEIRGDTAVLTRFHELLCRTAHGLLDPTKPDGPDLVHRKITALGVITDLASGTTTASAAGSSSASTTVHVHVNADDLDAEGPVMGFAEGLGPVTVERIRRWVSQGRVRIQPVLDLGRSDGIDEHDPPGWMRELVVQRDATCVFPWCHQDSRRCDLDHTEPYVSPDDGGPPDQTRPDNLAPLCRRHHRAKTFGGWSYERALDGSYAWTDPHGARFTTDPPPRGGGR